VEEPDVGHIGCIADLGFWTLDPIDGTLGFLRGGQYAVCLALIVAGEPWVGVLACPNLPFNLKDESSKRGIMTYVVKGNQTFECPLGGDIDAESTSCKMKAVTDLSQATFVESVESGHSSHSQQSQIAQLLGIETESVRMDSQAKYAALARGAAEIYLRLPVSMTYEERIWVTPL